MAFLLFFTAVVLSGIAAYYSVIGLIAIFSAAALPVAVMGGSLEVAKLVVASWLYRYWRAVPFLMKTYFTVALLILMLITSMGIFGFLSKAHSDQSLVSGDVLARLEIIDEKIKTEKENIDAARRALAQMDSQVNERLSRSTDDRGAERAVQIRRQQQAERSRLQKDIVTAQNNISRLNDEAAPIRTEVRKVEAEVGPLKYIAALIYGDNPDANLLERAVRWLIILLIVVFDPLAVLMLIAANLTLIKQKEWSKKDQESNTESLEPKKEIVVDDKQYKIIPDQAELPVAAQAATQPETQANDGKTVAASTEQPATMETVGVDPTPIGWMFDTIPANEKPKKKVRKTPKKPKVDIASTAVDTRTVEQPIEKNTEDKSLVNGRVGKPIAVDEQVQEMIDNNDQQGLEQVYKKIVKELAKKNRSKSTHWGPIKNNKNG